jgi:nucleoside-diphosphate-sugar epimerase
MKVLVTGGTGFIGSHLVDHLLADNHQVRCLVRRTSDRKWLVGKPIDYIECNLTGGPGPIQEAVWDVELVFHVLGTLVAPNLQAFREVNVRPVRRLLEACSRQSSIKRFVLVGSQGAAGPTPSPDRPLSETDPCHPVSAYGQSKLEAEEVVREFWRQVPCTIVRLSAVYGPRDVNLLRIFRSAALKGKVPQIGMQPKSLTLAHVQDVVEGIYRAGTAKNSPGEIYFLGSEEVYSFEDIRAALAQAIDKKVVIRVVPNLVVKGMMLYADFLSKVFKKDVLLNRDRLATLSYPCWVCDVSKARRDLGYRQAVLLALGFQSTYEWYRKEGWLV